MAKKSVRPFSYDSVDTFFDVVPPEGRKEILLLECKESGDRPHHSDFELVGECMKWAPSPIIFKSRRQHFLISMTLHQQMDTPLGPIFKNRQVKNYNVISSLEDIKHMIHNQRFYLENLDSYLPHVEGFPVSDSASGDLTDPADDSAQAPTTIPSSDHEYRCMVLQSILACELKRMASSRGSQLYFG